MIEEFKNKLDKIKSSFNEHKEKIGIFPGNSILPLEKIKEVFSLISQDYKELEDLIIKIEENINILYKHKNKSTLGLICLWILVIVE